MKLSKKLVVIALWVIIGLLIGTYGRWGRENSPASAVSDDVLRKISSRISANVRALTFLCNETKESPDQRVHNTAIVTLKSLLASYDDIATVSEYNSFLVTETRTEAAALLAQLKQLNSTSSAEQPRRTIVLP